MVLGFDGVELPAYVITLARAKLALAVAAPAKAMAAFAIAPVRFAAVEVDETAAADVASALAWPRHGAAGLRAALAGVARLPRAARGQPRPGRPARANSLFGTCSPAWIASWL